MAENIHHFPNILYTERLTLTLFDHNSSKDCTEFESALVVLARGVLNAPNPEQNAKDALEYYKTGGRIEPRFLGGRKADRAALWLVRLGADKPGGEVIGISSMIHRAYIPDQGWVILPQYQGQGYATEAAREVLRYFRDTLGIQNLMAPMHQGNSNSLNVARKLGYVRREGGLMSEGGVLLDLQTLPGAALPPDDFVLERWGRPSNS